MENAVFWDVTPCGPCKNRRSEELSASFIRVTRIGELGTTLAATSKTMQFGKIVPVPLLKVYMEVKGGWVRTERVGDF
jgi:hypothetical protein